MNEKAQNSRNREDRRYFRIQDHIGISYLILTDAEYHSRKIASQYAEIPALDELSEIEQQLELLFEKVKIRTPEVAEMGKLLNQKLKILVNNSGIAEGLTHAEDIPEQLVDMSAVGMALGVNEAIDTGQYLEIHMVLQSGRQYLKLLARMVNCEEGYEGAEADSGRFSHTARVEFINVSERIQEFLIQYVVKRQSAQIKAKRNPGLTPIDKMTW
ncbi:MAG: PilZ domain-containing protein [Proteobacteria bacterium]|nr:PilZ domain-containing protein [Pseudomonadota bacterium]